MVRKSFNKHGKRIVSGTYWLYPSIDCTPQPGWSRLLSQRSGGPKLKGSAAYPRGYAERLLKLHRPFMATALNIDRSKKDNLWYSGPAGQTSFFLKKYVNMAAKKMVQSDIRAGNLGVQSCVDRSKVFWYSWTCDEVRTGNVWDVADLVQVHRTLKRLQKDGYFHKWYIIFIIIYTTPMGTSSREITVRWPWDRRES